MGMVFLCHILWKKHTYYKGKDNSTRFLFHELSSQNIHLIILKQIIKKNLNINLIK
jgi:N-acetylmuramoyl-L-alanine amidase CwlA